MCILVLGIHITTYFEEDYIRNIYLKRMKVYVQYHQLHDRVWPGLCKKLLCNTMTSSIQEAHLLLLHIGAIGALIGKGRMCNFCGGGIHNFLANSIYSIYSNFC